MRGGGVKVTEALHCGSKDTLEAQWRISAGWGKRDAAADSLVAMMV